MTSIIRSPFYIPRPSDDAYWAGFGNGEQNNSATIQMLTSQKMQGAGGQVVTKKWGPHQTQDDATTWSGFGYGEPNNSATIQILSSFKMFGAGGQPPTKQWRITYTQDDHGPWSGHGKLESINSGIITQLTVHNGLLLTTWLPSYPVPYDEASWHFVKSTSSIAYIIKAKAPFSQPYVISYDEPSTWQQPPSNALPLNTITVNPFHHSVSISYDDSSTWQQPPSNVLPLNTTTVNPFQHTVSIIYDDFSGWLGSGINESNASGTLPILSSFKMFGAGGQSPTKQWHYDFDDASVWLASQKRGLIIQYLTNQKMFDAFGQVLVKQWHYDNDDASYWFVIPKVSNSIINAVPKPSYSFSPKFYIQNYMFEPSSWFTQTPVVSPSILNTGNLVNYFLMPQMYVPSQSYDPVWSGFPVTETITLSLAPPNQSYTKQWHYDFDDAALGISTNSINTSISLISSSKGVIGYICAPQFYVPTQPYDPTWYSQTYKMSTTISSVVISGLKYIFTPQFYVPTQPYDPAWCNQTNYTSIASIIGIYSNTIYKLESMNVSFDNYETGLWAFNSATASAILPYQGSTGATNYLFTPQFYVPHAPYDPAWNINRYSATTILKQSLGIYKLESMDVKFQGDFVDWLGSSSTRSLTYTLPPINPYIPVPWRFNNDDESVWNVPSIRTPSINYMLHAGQPPTKDWAVSYTLDDASVWYASPNKAPVFDYLTLSGQPPTKLWDSCYTQDDATIWYASPDKAPLVSYLTLGGKPPTKSWVSPYTQDDAAFWNAKPHKGTVVVSFTSGGQPPTKQWHYDYDDAAFWNVPPVKSPIAGYLTQGGQPPTKQWHYDNDDATVWNIPPVRSKSVEFFTLGGQPPTKAWITAYTQDDASFWLASPINSSIADYLTLGGQPPTKSWYYGNDEGAIWVQPSQRSIGLPFVPAINNRWQLHPGSEEPWWLTTQRDLSLLVTPFTLRQVGVFHADDQAIWQQPVQRQLLLISTPVTSGQTPQGSIFPIFTVDDPPSWQQPSQPPALLLTAPPFVIRPGSFLFDDSAIWQQQPQPPVLLTAVPFVIRPGSFLFDEPAIWRQPRQRLILATGGEPFSVRQPSFLFDDPAIWQQPTQRSIALPFVPEINNARRFNTPEDQLWMLVPRRQTTTVTYTPFIFRQPTFWNDDWSSYQWPIRSELILSLLWRVNTKRIAVTSAEIRSATTTAVDQATASGSMTGNAPTGDI